MVELNVWVDDLVIDTGCTRAIAQRKLMDAAIEFCTLSNAWQYNGEPMFTAPDIADYELWPPKHTQVGRIIRLTDATSRQREYQPLDRPEHYHNGFAYYHGAPNTVRLFPTPRDSRELSLTISLIPQRTATEVGDILSDRWFEALREGALYRLKLMPGREWSDPAMAKQHHERLFRRLVGDAIQATNAGYSDAPQTVKHVPFG